MNLPPRFLNYLRSWNAEKGKYEKFPCDPSGRKIDAHDIRFHLTREEAEKHATFSDDPAKPYGLAFDIRAEDGLFFLDLDDCRQPDGNWTAESTAVFTSFTGAWGEVSTSGNGLHILGRCDPAKLQDRRNKWNGNKFEFYTDRRLIAFGPTGWAPIGGVHDPARDFTGLLLNLVPMREIMGELPDEVDPSYTGPNDDETLIQMMLRSGGGAGAAFGMKATVKDLWEANGDVLGRMYPAFDGYDRSSADAALMSHLAFWTGKDMPRMDRLFRRSGLMREKYEKREDYRRDTVQGAARMCSKVYDRPAPGTGDSGNANWGGATGHDPYMNVADMQDHFAGCTYIRDTHRVMVPGGAMLKPEQFDATYGGHIFQMMPDLTKPTESAFKALTQNRAIRFPQAIRPCFRPDEPGGSIGDDGAINTYFPPDVDMTPGDVTPFTDHLAKLLPDGNDREILTCYLASLVQNPGVKFQWAPVLQGCEGNGKTLVFSAASYALGRQYTHQPKPKHLGGQFNSYLEGKLFILVEEVHMRGRMEVLDELKTLITNVEVEVEQKGQDKRMITNVANWGFCTNYQDAVIKSRNDRRYAVMFTAQQSIDDVARDGMSGSYFPDLYGWLRGGGYAHVAAWLAAYEIPESLDPARGCHRAPDTTSTAAAIAKTMGGVEHEIMEAAEDNTVGFRGGWVSSWALDKLLKDRGYRLTRNRQADILLDMGYVTAGRATSPIMAEDGKRPMLYARPGVTGSVKDYCAAQHYPI